MYNDNMVYLLLAALLLAAFYVYLLMPSRCSLAKRTPFAGRTYAHRGLYMKNQSVPENSLAAFKAAVQHGYGVELDVQFTKDKQLVVFHDDTLNRACGVDARVDAFTFEQLQQMPLFNTEHHIPLFVDVLAVLDSKVPVIVEIKSVKDYAPLCSATLSVLLEYKGVYCVESFDPRMVRWFRKNAPHIVRGQLSEPYRGWRKGCGTVSAYGMSHLLTDFLTRPNFIAFGIHGKRNHAWFLCKLFGAMMVCWTVRPDDNFEKLKMQYDATIFEHFFPDTRYY